MEALFFDLKMLENIFRREFECIHRGTSQQIWQDVLGLQMRRLLGYDLGELAISWKREMGIYTSSMLLFGLDRPMGSI